MNTKQFITALLAGYPEVLRPGDKEYLRTIQDNLQAINPSGETLRSVYKRLLDTCERFPVWALIRQTIDSIQAEQRAGNSGKSTSASFDRWKLESCSLDEALPYMVEQLVDSGEMSRELLAAITGKNEALGINLCHNQPTLHSPRVVGWNHAGTVPAMPMLKGALPLRRADRPNAETDPVHSSIAALDISRGGIPVDSDIAAMGPGQSMWGILEDSVFPRTGPCSGKDGTPGLDRCGSCGKYFLKGEGCGCEGGSAADDCLIRELCGMNKGVGEYDDSERLEDL